MIAGCHYDDDRRSSQKTSSFSLFLTFALFRLLLLLRYFLINIHPGYGGRRKVDRWRGGGGGGSPFCPFFTPSESCNATNKSPENERSGRRRAVMQSKRQKKSLSPHINIGEKSLTYQSPITLQIFNPYRSWLVRKWLSRQTRANLFWGCVDKYDWQIWQI